MRPGANTPLRRSAPGGATRCRLYPSVEARDNIPVHTGARVQARAGARGRGRAHIESNHEEARAREDAAEERVDVRRRARVDEVAVDVRLPAVGHVAHEHGAMPTNAGCVAHEHAVERLLAQVVMARRHHVRRAQLEEGLHRHHGALLELERQARAAQLEHLLRADVGRHLRLQVRVRLEQLRPSAAEGRLLHLLDVAQVADVPFARLLAVRQQLLVQLALRPRQCGLQHARTRAATQQRREVGGRGALRLDCHCCPRRCHGESVRARLVAALGA